MDESGSGFRFDIQQILSEVQHRWLRPAEICEILRNYHKLHISPEAPTKPVSGSVFLFDRKVLRYFRKDGHNWRKKKDGKTVKEAHEKLKVGSVDMLHCYYAHGEENENFQRRSYWLLEQDLMHIVFVHYLEVKGSKASTSSARNSDGVLNSGIDGSVSSTYCGTSPSSPLSSAYEEGESDGNHQARSEFRPYPESPQAADCQYSQSGSFDLPFNTGNQSLFDMDAYTPHLVADDGQEFAEGSFVSSAAAAVNLALWPEETANPAADDIWQEIDNLPPEKSPLDQLNMGPFHSNIELKAQHGNIPLVLSGEEIENAAAQNLDKSMPETGTENYSFILKKPLLNTLQSEESLKKVDSFSRWMVKELGEADELAMQPSSGISWSIIGNEYESNMPAQLEVDTEILSPSISQDQLFSITDFSPHWAFSNRQAKVVIAGMFLKGEVESSECSWSIMFGQVEVPAEVLHDGILCCTAPLHDPGLLPFYVTCSNRLACSEVREFEYRANSGTITAPDEVNEGSAAVMHLYQRFEMILQLKANENPLICTGDDFEKHTISLSITSLREEDNSLDEKLSSENDLLHLGELLIEKKLRKQFFSWILHRVDDDGIGLTVCDEGGQSVLHLAAALGFSWSFQPFLIAGVRVDFRDVNGWTALHWAAFYGREEAVVALVSFGANPGALTDPCNAFPLSRTPADLASSRGHKGISGFLAESDLTTHLSALRVQDDDGAADASAVQTLSERVAAPTIEEDIPDKLSLKDSVAAVCNAAQAAARIHQIFRIQSFQRKQFIEHSSDELQNLDEQVISVAAGKTSRLGHSHGMANAAAIQIQKKYRGWKKRKEFLLIRQKIVKIQAHVRGHQARKKYKNFSWSVGIVEKVILRWRRKKNGLRRHQPIGDEAECSMQDGLSVPLSPPRDDYEAWKKGRKETEQRMQKALARVKSMAQHPEARAQYRRLLTAAEVLRESKDTLDIEIPDAPDDNMALSDDNLLDFECLLDDETFMNLAFQ